MINKNIHILILSALVLGLLSGCQKNRIEAVKEVLAHDPSFNSILEKRDALEKELNANKMVYLDKNRAIDDQIAILKENKLKVKHNYYVTSENIKKQIEPDAGKLRQDIAEKKREYGRKKEALSDILRDISDVSELMGKKDNLTLTSEEVASWNKRLTSLKKNENEVQKEMVKLEKEIEIIKLKIQVLALK